MDSIPFLAKKFSVIWPLLDERTRRIMAANEAMGLGYGGVSMVHRACGLSRKAIVNGIQEIEEGTLPLAGRIRRPGAGRKNLTVSDPALLVALDDLIEGGTRGDPESPLRWICKSTRTLAAELCQQHHPISYVRVAQLLREQHYLQSTRKLEEGEDHPDRDAQFRHIKQLREASSGVYEAGDIRGHQKERTGGKLRERWPAMATGQTTPEGPGARLPGSGSAPRLSLWHL